MAAIRLELVVFQAERLRLTLLVKRHVRRGVLGVAAFVFALCAFAMLHVTGVLALGQVLSPLSSALIMMAMDMLVAMGFGLLAARNTPGRLEVEAREVRLRAIRQGTQYGSGPLGVLAARSVFSADSIRSEAVTLQGGECILERPGGIVEGPYHDDFQLGAGVCRVARNLNPPTVEPLLGPRWRSTVEPRSPIFRF